MTMEFIHVIRDYPFMRYAVMAGFLASLACGITGTFVVVKRMGYVSGGIAHTALGGIGIALYCGFNPLYGAVMAALLAAVILGLVTLRVREHADTVISALWATGMAVGVIFMSMTPGYNAGLMTYLFGNILMVSGPDIRVLLYLDLGIIVIVMIFFRQFVAMAFDQDYARLRGLKVEFLYLLLLCLIALTIVVLIRIVGLILVIALLTLPAAIAGNFVRRISRMIFLAIILGFIFTLGGLALSYGPDLPSGATIIVLSGISYIISLGIRRVRNRLATGKPLRKRQ